MSYKSDTLLLKEEVYDILPDGSKALTSLSLYDGNADRYIFLVIKIQ